MSAGIPEYCDSIAILAQRVRDLHTQGMAPDLAESVLAAVREIDSQMASVVDMVEDPID